MAMLLELLICPASTPFETSLECTGMQCKICHREACALQSERVLCFLCCAFVYACVNMSTTFLELVGPPKNLGVFFKILAAALFDVQKGTAKLPMSRG